MDNIIKGLEDVKAAAKNRTQSVNKYKILKKANYESLLQVVEDTLSKIHSIYMLDITESIISGSIMDKTIHTELTRALELFEKTKKEIDKTVQRTKTDPITIEHLCKVLDELKYTTQ